jgi:hypothetical protein
VGVRNGYPFFLPGMADAWWGWRRDGVFREVREREDRQRARARGVGIIFNGLHKWSAIRTVCCTWKQKVEFDWWRCTSAL